MSIVAAETECCLDAEEEELPATFTAGFVSGLDSMLLEENWWLLLFPINAGGGFD